MLNYVQYTLHLEEPVKMGRQGSQTSTEALTYLAGSTIRGAVLTKVIRDWYGEESEDLAGNAEKRSTLFRDTYFYDAFPCVGNREMIPVPAVYYADKHKVREARAEEEKNRSCPVSVHCCISDVPSEGEVRLGAGQYCCFEDRYIRNYSVHKEANLHIRVGKDEEDSAVFRYEAIAAGQDFTGLIRCKNEEEAEKYRKAVTGEIFYLGGSRGSGYGRCIVSSAELKSYEDVRSAYPASAGSESSGFTVYALSNLILLNKDGSETGYIPADLLESILKVSKVRPVRAFSGITRTAGFNHTWKSDLVQRSSVTMGSVFTFACEGTPDPEGIRLLEEKGIGQRRQEGFGRVLINPDLERKAFLKAEADTADESPIVFTGEDESMLRLMECYINSKREETSVRDAALAFTKEHSGGLRQISLSQKARLFNLLQSLETDESFKDDAAARERLRVFAEKDLKTKSRESFEKARVVLPEADQKGRNQYSLRELLLEIASDRVSHSQMNVYWEELKGLSLTGSEPAMSSNFRLNIRFLKEVFYNLMRKEGGRK